METKKYKCLDNYVNYEGLTCFKKNNIYFFKEISKNVFYTEKNELGYSHQLDGDDIKGYFSLLSKDEKSENIDQLETPKHYDNSKGTLYKVATERGWNPYLFDIVKRLERSEKKGEFKTDLEKSINVIKLWLQENDN